MKRILDIFKIRKGERLAAIVALVLFTSLLAMMLCYNFADYKEALGYRRSAVFSGFDLTIWWMLKEWSVAYALLRHPLICLLFYPVSMLCDGLHSLTGSYVIVFVQAAIWLFLDVYAYIFLFRTLRSSMRLRTIDSLILTTLFFSLAYVMIACVAPDHMALTLFLLTMTLLVTSRHIATGKRMNRLTACLLLFLSAGVTTTNGVKILFADWFCGTYRGIAHFLRSNIAYIIPILMLVGAFYAQQELIQKPQAYKAEMKKQERMKRDPAYKARLMKVRGKASSTKSTQIVKGKLFEFTDSTVARWPSLKHNILGEGWQLHEQHLMKDVNSAFRTRPLYVDYTNPINPFVEVFLCLLVVIGCWIGRRERLLWVVLSWFLFDMMLHLGFTFAIKDAYIMTAHWALIVPVAMAFIMKKAASKGQKNLLTATFGLLTVWLLGWNGYWLYTYFV